MAHLGFSASEAKTSMETTYEHKKRRFRKKSEDEDDEVVARGEEERRVRRRTEHYDDAESLLDDDQREREKLEQNLRERDAAATRKLTEPKLSEKEEEEAAIRRSKALDIQALRKVSRQAYLKKREQKKLEEIRDDIEDEQYLFEGVELTEAEYRELRYKKQIYELVKKRSEEAEDTAEYLGCQRHMIGKAVLIRTRDLLWPCS